jgi:hypothetical protein
VFGALALWVEVQAAGERPLPLAGGRRQSAQGGAQPRGTGATGGGHRPGGDPAPALTPKPVVFGRLERSQPLLDLLKPQIEAAGAQALPSSALGKAVTYTLALWPKLTRFLKHPEVELSNNLAENSMRPVAPGRKNWIHVGSPQAGPKVAAILSIVESCRRLKVPVRDYLGAVLPGLANTSIQRLAEFTPAAWAARNQ